MSLEKYLQWCIVENTVESRLRDYSLVCPNNHEKRVRKSTKLINKVLKKKLNKQSYSEFKESKQKILQQLTENNDMTDETDFSDSELKTFYESFNVSCRTNSDEDNFNGLLWNYIDKKGREKVEPKDPMPSCILEPNIEINEIKTNEDFENSIKDSRIRKQKQVIENAKSTKKEETLKRLIKSKNLNNNSSSINNKKLNSVDSKTIIRKKSSVKEKDSSKSKQSVSNESSKSVKKNLTSVLDSVSLQSQEFVGDEWNEDFAPSEFQAQSTQIFSETFSEKKPISRYNIDHRLSHEVINQPRDSGIEEDSREDNAKFENPINENDCKKNQDNDEPTTFNGQNRDNLDDVNDFNQNEMKISPIKKIPLKIIGEERVTKKFKIITKKDEELKPIEEENKAELSKPESSDSGVKVNTTNEKSESSSESDSEFADCHDVDNSQHNRSESDSSDQYYDLQDDGSEKNSEGTPNKIENKEAESDSSSTDESIIRKRELKEELKKFKSPFMIRRYNELKKSRVLEESESESVIKIYKSSEKKSGKKKLSTMSKSSKKKITNQLKVPSLQNVQKTQEKVTDDESFEEKTLVSENFIDNSVLTNGSNENVDDIENDMEETPNLAKLRQIKRLNLLAGSDESDDSEDENIQKKVDDIEKGTSRSPKRKQNQQQEKRLNTQSTYKDSDESENESKNKSISSKIENVNLPKSNENDSDSAVSETTHSQSSQKTEQYSKKNEKYKMQKLSDKDTSSNEDSSADEKSIEIGPQSDLKNTADNYKQSPLTQIPNNTEDLSESDEHSNISTQFQPTESQDYGSSDDSEYSDAEKTVIDVKNKSKVHKKKSDSDSEEKDKSLENKSPKVNNMKQETKTLKESSSEESDSDLEIPENNISDAIVSKKDDSEDEFNMSSKAKENLSKMKRLDLLNSDEDSEDSQDAVKEKNYCNSDVDIEEHKIEDIPSCDDLQTKDGVLENQLKSSDDDSSDKFDFEKPNKTCKTSKSKSKHLSSGFSSVKGSEAEPDTDGNSSNSSKNKTTHKRKFEQIDTTDMNDREASVTSQEIDVVHYSSENDVSDRRKIKKLKSSNHAARTIAEEKNIDPLPSNSFNVTKLHSASSENEDSDGDQAMSHSSKQKILKLRKMNLLAHNSSSSSEDEKEIVNSQCTFKKGHKKVVAKKNSSSSNSDSDSVSKKKKDLDDFNIKINPNQNHKKVVAKTNSASSNSDSDSDSDSEKEKDLDDFNIKELKKQNQVKKNEKLDEKDSEEESTVSSKTKERLNKMKRLDLLNSDDDSKDGIVDINCNSDIDIEEHKIEDILLEDNLEKYKKSQSQVNSSDSDSEKPDASKSKTKTKNLTKQKLKEESTTKNEITSKKTSKLNSTSVPTDDALVDDSFEKKKDEIKENKNKKNHIIEETQMDEKDDENDVNNESVYVLDEKNFKNEDSEEEYTMSSKTKERLNKMKRLDLFNSDDDSKDSDDSKDGITDKNYCNSDVDIEEHKIEDILPEENLEKHKKSQSQVNSSDSDSEKSDSSKSKTKTKNLTKQKLKEESTTKNEITSKKTLKLNSTSVPADDALVDDSFEKKKDEIKESKKNKKNDIIEETQENAHSQVSNLESQPMFSSLEDLREGIDEKQLNLNSTDSHNANSAKDRNQISPTQASKKTFADKITKISELVEKESLEKISCQSSLRLNNISADEEIFLFEVPKTIFKENLIGKKLSFSKTTLTVGDNKYEVYQKQVSPTYSCVFKTEKKAIDSFITQNIRPVATIIARRKKFIDESLKDVDTDAEIDEEVEEHTTNNEPTNFDNANDSSKDENTSMKVTKKVTKRSPKKSEKKVVLDSSVKLNKKESTKNAKSKNNIFNIKDFIMKPSEVSKIEKSPKERKKLLRKKQGLSASTLNNYEVAKDEDSDNNNLGEPKEEAHASTKVKKPLIKEDININTSTDNKSKKPVNSPGKLKNAKFSVEDVKETKDSKESDEKVTAKPVIKSVKPASKSPAKKRKAENQVNGVANQDGNEETKKKRKVTAEKKAPAKKRKAENQSNGDANEDANQETRKKQKVTAEKKEKKPTAKKANPRNQKKKVNVQSGESASDQIRKLIAKNIKFDDSLNDSFDPSNYNPLDIQRISKKVKRYQSTTSSSSDDESTFKRRSFHVREKPKTEDDKQAVASTSSSADVKSEDKKSVKKVFFNE